MSRFIRWDVIAMAIALGVVFGFEMLGVFTDRYVTITAIVRAYVPKWACAMVCGWLFYHFVIQ
ncbi:MAG: hypothetical protein ACRD3E_09335 [Terriglobales bacterium]